MIAIAAPPAWPPWIDALLEALDNAGLGLVITAEGPDGMVRLHDNRTSERILGRTSAELRAIPPMSLLPPGERDRLVALRAEIDAGTPPPALIETEVVRPDGTRVPIELGFATIVDGDRRIALIFMRDVSERRALQARLLEADRLATVGALCAGLAHEINNPLTSVLLHLGGLRRSLERWVNDPAGREHVAVALDAVLDGAGRIGRAVRQVMVFADPAIARGEAVDLRAVVSGAARAAAPIVETRARLTVALADVPAVDGDAVRLGQAVLNVILDAAVAFDDDDRDRNLVEIRLRAEAPWVVVEVADNGRALAPRDAGHAFEPFFPVRGEASTGIGLAVTRTIVAASGGSVSLAASDAGGAVATIRLPTR